MCKSKKYFLETKYIDIYRLTNASLACQMSNIRRPYSREQLVPKLNASLLNQIGLEICGPFPTT